MLTLPNSSLSKTLSLCCLVSLQTIFSTIIIWFYTKSRHQLSRTRLETRDPAERTRRTGSPLLINCTVLFPPTYRFWMEKNFEFETEDAFRACSRRARSMNLIRHDTRLELYSILINTRHIIKQSIYRLSTLNKKQDDDIRLRTLNIIVRLYIL